MAELPDQIRYEEDLTGKKSQEQMSFKAQELLLKEPKAVALYCVTGSKGVFEFVTDSSGLDQRNRLRFRLQVMDELRRDIVHDYPELAGKV